MILTANQVATQSPSVAAAAPCILVITWDPLVNVSSSVYFILTVNSQVSRSVTVNSTVTSAAFGVPECGRHLIQLHAENSSCNSSSQTISRVVTDTIPMMNDLLHDPQTPPVPSINLASILTIKLSVMVLMLTVILIIVM